MAGDTPSTGAPIVEVADLTVDLAAETVHRAGEPLELPHLSFRLLAALIRHAPNRVDKDTLIDDVWQGGVVSDETLAQRVRLLRQALGEDSRSPRYIAAVRGRGYRLICPVSVRTSGGRAVPSRRWLLVAASVLGVAGLLAGLWLARTAPPISSVEAVAVLPFDDLSPGGGYRYFADGMQEELLSRLTRFGDLAVLSRTSTERFRGSAVTIPDIGRRLGADAVIEGSVRVAGPQVRITVQLIDAANDRHLWADSYERELTVRDVFAIQADVANQVARALALEYAAANRSQTPGIPTENLAAYNAYLLGRYHTFRQTAGDLAQAVEHLENATALDPQFAEAYAALGWAHSFRGTSYGRQRPGDVYPKAREAALRALAIDSDLADARSLYADILTWYDWDFQAAEREYRKTEAIDPYTVLGYALFLSSQQRHDEAIERVERRLSVHPDDPYVHVNAGWRYLHAGDFERAVAAGERGRSHPDAASLIGHAQLGAGRVIDAIATFEADLATTGRRPRQVANLASAFFRAGRVAEGRDLLAELERAARERYVSPVVLAAPAFAAGDADTGFARLRDAVKQRDRGVIFLKVTPMLDDYRDDPRYETLLRDVGLVDVSSRI